MSTQVRPPRLANKLLQWYCSNAMIEDLEGDLEELFENNVQRMPLWKARLSYWQAVFSLIRSYSVKARKKNAAAHALAGSGLSFAMLENYIKVATRSLAKHKLFTIINTLGLAVGMSISLLFIAMLSFVGTYDTFHENRNQLYRVITHASEAGRSNTYASSPSVLAAEISQQLPGLQAPVHISSKLNGLASIDTKEIPINGYFAGVNFFEVFTFPIAEGSIKSLLSGKYVAITKKASEKLFGDEEALGKTFEVEPWGEFIVGAVLQDIPKNSHMVFDVIAPYAFYESQVTPTDPWKEFRDHYTYIHVTNDQELQRINSLLASLKVPIKDESGETTFSLQAFNDITPGPDHSNQIGPSWDYTSFSIFAVLILLILVPACFNYANISISRTLKRAKEIGLRKTVGGQQIQIFYQFITETVLISLLALVLAFLIFRAIRQEFLNMIISSEALDLSPDLRTILYFILFAVLVGFLAGALPALYLSRLSPVQALKNSASLKSVKGLSVRKALIVFQFALSLGFIMSVVIVIKQYHSSLNYDFGFAQENILDVELQGMKPELVKSEFANINGVKELSMSSGILGSNGVDVATGQFENGDSAQFHQLFIDEDFIANLDLELLAGNDFGEDMLRNSRSAIINENFLGLLNVKSPHDAIGKTFVVEDTLEIQVVGILKDFHYLGLQSPIGSFAFRYRPEEFRYANLSLSSDDIYGTISSLENSWGKIAGSVKFQSRFFEDEIEETFSFYFSMIKICGFLGFLAITISCLGLLGMVVYSAETRLKEIGIRKVMGATTLQLIFTLSKGYLMMLLIAAAIAIPITIQIFSQGLLPLTYYRFEIGATEILLSLSIVFILGIVTILSQTIRTSRANPVDTLRSE